MVAYGSTRGLRTLTENGFNRPFSRFGTFRVHPYPSAFSKTEAGCFCPFRNGVDSRMVARWANGFALGIHAFRYLPLPEVQVPFDSEAVPTGERTEFFEREISPFFFLSDDEPEERLAVFLVFGSVPGPTSIKILGDDHRVRGIFLGSGLSKRVENAFWHEFHEMRT